MAFESERPFRLLHARCLKAFGPAGAMAAYYLYARLWVDLALESRATDRPGYLSAESAEMLADRVRKDMASTMGAAMPDPGWEPIRMLRDAQVLEPIEGDGGYVCPHFNIDGMNEHTRRGYQMAQKKGGLFGGLSRREKRVNRAAADAALTLLPADGDRYHDTDGEPLDAARRTAAIALIHTLDQALRLPQRPIYAAYWPTGMVAMADAVNRRFVPMEINVNGRMVSGTKAVALYLLANDGDARLPRETQQALQMFEVLHARASEYHKSR